MIDLNIEHACDMNDLENEAFKVLKTSWANIETTCISLGFTLEMVMW